MTEPCVLGTILVRLTFFFFLTDLLSFFSIQGLCEIFNGCPISKASGSGQRGQESGSGMASVWSRPLPTGMELGPQRENDFSKITGTVGGQDEDPVSGILMFSSHSTFPICSDSCLSMTLSPQSGFICPFSLFPSRQRDGGCILAHEQL